MSASNDKSWVVYLITLHKNAGQLRAVCEQGEWEAMERAQPGRHTLIKSGIRTETEAELIARGTSGDAKARQPRARA
jgi:hypothetical protein